MTLSLTRTFLFTDIEGSTKLWEAYPSAMQVALARHDALLREAIEQHNGVVFKTIGDAFCAVFEDPHAGIRAMVLAQQALAKEGWPTPHPLRVRMALHTGVAECRDNDYFGPPLNRVARLLSIGHGGQTLLSLATTELVRDQLDPSFRLLELGSHRLKDLIRPEHVFQLNAPELPERFPALRSLNRFPNNLPQQLTSFLGREAELNKVMTLLSSSRLVTLTGSGGCGKSRLALQLGADLLERYPDGVWFVELAALTDPALVPQTIAGAIGISGLTGNPTQALSQALSDRHALFILDNCEHLIQGSASLVNTLLRACPQLVILATSREALQVSGEMLFRVPSLSLPERHPPPPADKLSQFTAVQLFVERAQAVRADFAVTNANAPAVAEICWKLDGIPLAIELAAARLRSMRIEDLLTRLEDRFRIVVGGNPDRLPRQQTLRALIDWSYDLLHENEQVLLSRLSVFMGGWTLEAAEGICSGAVLPPTPESATPNNGGLGGGRGSAGSPLLGRGGNIEDWEVLDLLSSLVDKSLAQFDGSRYKMLETIKQYAQEKAKDQTEPLRERHVAWFRRASEDALECFVTQGEFGALAALRSDSDNLRSALGFAIQHQDTMSALALAGCPRWTWHHYQEGIDSLEPALARAPHEDTVLRGFALTTLGMLYRYQNRREDAITTTREALALHRRLDHRSGIADALNNLAVSLTELAPELTEALAEEGIALLEEGCRLNRQQGNVLFETHCLGSIGLTYLLQNQFDRARPYLEQTGQRFRELEDSMSLGPWADSLAELHFREGNLEESSRYLREALQINFRNPLWNEVANQLVNLGRNAGLAGAHFRAVRLQSAGAALCRRYFIPNLIPIYEVYTATCLATARAVLSPDDYERAWKEGQALSTEEAIQYALSNEGMP